MSTPSQLNQSFSYKEESFLRCSTHRRNIHSNTMSLPYRDKTLQILLTKVFPTETSISKSYQRKSLYKWFPSTGFHQRYSNDSLRHTTWHSWPSWGKSRYRRFNHPLMSCRHQHQDKQCRHHPSSTRVSLLTKVFPTETSFHQRYSNDSLRHTTWHS